MSIDIKYIVFFDIGGTLGSPKISPPPYRLVALDVYPYVPGVLKQLLKNKVRIGIISNTGSETTEDMRRVLEKSKIYQFFEPTLLIYSSVVGKKKDSPEIFKLAASISGHSGAPERCLFVGEDSRERSYAMEAGFRVAPHPRLAWEVLNNERLRYVCVTVPIDQSKKGWRKVMRGLPIVPLYVTGDKGTRVYAIATASALASLDDLGFEVNRLGAPDGPLRTDVYLLRDDLQARTGFLNPQGQSKSLFSKDEESKLVLSSFKGGLYIALPAGRSIENYHFKEAYHGHTLKLMPDMSLLEPFGKGKNAKKAGFLRLPEEEPSLSNHELEMLSEITPELIQGYLERYTGIKPVDPGSGAKIVSRHIHHPSNAESVESLARDLEAIGNGIFSVNIHQFTHEGRLLENVEAELPGSGESDEVVLITAHLDSTAAFSDHPYDPKKDPAPGADDDASGVSAVLAIANAIKKMAEDKRPRRNIRFVLFNAEEHGLIGSKAYAKDQAAVSAPITAVYQMDMVGYRGKNVNPPRPFEIHVGYKPSQDVERRSLILAERIKRLVEQVSPGLQPPQIYIEMDPASERSDHASFHERGYGACAVSEDFFAGPRPDSPEPEPNPNYHKDTDNHVSFEFASDIARVVAAAAWITANS
jgi:hypothetical protein